MTQRSGRLYITNAKTLLRGVGYAIPNSDARVFVIVEFIKYEGTISIGLEVVQGTVFLATKYRFTRQPMGFDPTLLDAYPPPPKAAESVTVTGGITLFTTIVVTTYAPLLVTVVALKIQVVPPNGLFTLAVTTVVRITERSTPSALLSDERNEERVEPIMFTMGPIRYTRRFTTSALKRGQTNMGPTLLTDPGS